MNFWFVISFVRDKPIISFGSRIWIINEKLEYGYHKRVPVTLKMMNYLHQILNFQNTKIFITELHVRKLNSFRKVYNVTLDNTGLIDSYYWECQFNFNWKNISFNSPCAGIAEKNKYIYWPLNPPNSNNNLYISEVKNRSYIHENVVRNKIHVKRRYLMQVHYLKQSHQANV